MSGGINLRPDVFALVMATGIIAMSADDYHQRLISDMLTVLSVAALLSLVAVVFTSMMSGRGFAVRDLDDPDSALRMFTFVAACGVLAVHCEPHRLPFWILGATAVCAWLALVPIAVWALATTGPRQLRDRVRGAWLLASVGTCSVAIVLADAAHITGRRALLPAALALWALGVTSYGLVITLVAWRTVADRSTVDRWEADSWILMGGMAIATLTGNHVYRALGLSSSLRDAVGITTIAMWTAASAWIPLLGYLGLRRVRARPPRFSWAWWAMVFPLGMYSTATFATSADARLGVLSTISLVFFWIALAAWVVVAVMGVRFALTRR